jgi:hypothetical protein
VAPKIPAEQSLLPSDLPETPFAANLALDRVAREEVEEAKEEVSEKASEKALERLRKAIAAVERDIGASRPRHCGSRAKSSSPAGDSGRA